MKTKSIESLAYFMKQAKDNKMPSPIFFLGAGASKTGEIPLANEIIADILKNHSNNPDIKSLKPEEQSYPKLMECLGPHGRNQLLKAYIDSSKINVTHIYLAQLMKEDYVDYVLTVNFDNLMLRALALFNEFPPTYDMAILKDLTTTTFKEKSVVYLHGQHHGLWLLNTDDEMAKVKEVIPRILDKISNKRPWVFIGYSGEDPVLEHIKNLERFDNGLYWVTYKDNNPSQSVCDSLFDQPNTNAFLIKGYDADSFMLKLNSELDLPQPAIVGKPFSTLGVLLDNIVDIDDQEHYKDVKERLVIAKKQVSQAIQQFEQGKVESTETIQENYEISLLKKEIIDLLIKDEYQIDEISQLAAKAEAIDNIEINSLLAGLYNNWGNYLGNLAKTKTGEEAETLYQQAFDKYQQAIAIKPDQHESFNNWGAELGHLAKTKTGEEAEALYQQAFDKYQQAIAIKPGDYDVFNNWGTYLGDLAKTKTGEEAEALYQQAFDKYQQAIAIKPDDHKAFYNWGTYLGHLAKTKTGEEAEVLYQQAFDKYQQAIAIKPDQPDVFSNWGNALGRLGNTKTGEEAEALYQQVFEKYKTAYDLGGSSYNLACGYALKADKENALFYLDNSLKKKQISTEFVLDDEDWKSYLEDEGFNKIINLYAAF